jgi:hypothetical protein
VRVQALPALPRQAPASAPLLLWFTETLLKSFNSLAAADDATAAAAGWW